MRVLGLLLVAAGVAGIAAAWPATPARGGPATRAEIRIHFSHFGPTEVVATAGVPVTVFLVNTDPIDHEWIVGDDAVQQKHRTGTELLHPVRPTEQVIPAGQTRVTTITFEQPAVWQYICHLPGHEAYGMVGVATIVR